MLHFNILLFTWILCISFSEEFLSKNFDTMDFVTRINMNKNTYRTLSNRYIMDPSTYFNFNMTTLPPPYLIHRRLNHADIKNKLQNFEMSKQNNIFPSDSTTTTKIIKHTHTQTDSEDYINASKDFKEIIDTQTMILDNFAKYLSTFNILRSDFESLLDEMEKRKEDKIERDKTSTAKPRLSTIETVIDETEVKEMLKNDPLVKRILKMAKRKRQKYLNDAKKYFDLNNKANRMVDDDDDK